MADVVLDANVIVALLYEADAHHERAEALLDQIEADGHAAVLFDILVQEAVSVLCRRARERKTSPPALGRALISVRTWFRDGHVRFVAREAEHLSAEVLDVIEATGGALNFNDALLVVLEREGLVDHLAGFDPAFDAIPELPAHPLTEPRHRMLWVQLPAIQVAVTSMATAPTMQVVASEDRAAASGDSMARDARVGK